VSQPSPYSSLLAKPGIHLVQAAAVPSNPFDALDSLGPTAPVEDLMAQAKTPMIEDMEAEIAFLQEVRDQLADAMRNRAAASVERLTKRVAYKIEDRLGKILTEDNLHVVQATVEREIKQHLIKAEMTIEDAKALRDASGAIAKMMKQYRDIAAGMLIEVKFESQEFEKLMRAIFSVLDSAAQIRVADKLEEFAPTMGEQHKMGL